MNSETQQIFIVTTSVSEPSAPLQKIEDASMSTQDVEDFSTVCRTCATVTEFVIPIFEGEGLQNNLADKIHKHLPIQVTEDDVLPRVVCYQCASTLLAWHELVQCCVQADEALRARLPQEQKTSVTEPIANTAQVEPEFKEITDFVVQSLDPPQCEESPQYEASPQYEPSLLPPPDVAKTKSCAYCFTDQPELTYKEHLVAVHSDFLFHCDECDTYVDKKELILHMSHHAVEYEGKQPEVPDPAKRIKKRNKRKVDEKDVNANNERSDRKSYRKVNKSADSIEPEEKSQDESENNLDESQQNEFSDHSDNENGFGPLPDSVFEAIEDSQDCGNEESAYNSQDCSNQLPNGTDADIASPVAESQEKVTKKTRTCPICGKAYTAASSYFYHMKHFHRGSKEHECGVCGKKFGTKAALTQHEPIHTGIRAYECKECGKTFGAKPGLYIHEQTHGSTREWPCNQCGRKFRWRGQLARHMTRHAGERHHGCMHCPRRFSVRADLLRHMRTHAKQQHDCKHCSLQFAQLRYLKVHIRRKHPDAPIDDCATSVTEPVESPLDKSYTAIVDVTIPTSVSQSSVQIDESKSIS